MKKYACKRTCEKCFYCNETGFGYIDCFFGVYVDPSTSLTMPVQTDMENFHECEHYAEKGQ